MAGFGAARWRRAARRATLPPMPRLLLALLLLPLAAQAQITRQGEREICVANATTLPLRAEIDRGLGDAFTPVPPGGRHCARFPRVGLVQIQVQAFDGNAWVPACGQRVHGLPDSLTLTVRGQPGLLTCG